MLYCAQYMPGSGCVTAEPFRILMAMAGEPHA